MLRNPFADGLIVLVVVLLFFGPKRLPGLGKSLGSGIREFKDSITGAHDGEDDEAGDRPALTPGAGAAAPPAPGPSAEPAAPQDAGVARPGSAPARSEQA